MEKSKKNRSIGLTGGIGCGKSAAGLILSRLGLHHLDTDLVAREVVLPGTPGLDKVVKRFGKEVLTSDGFLKRAKLAEIIFSDPNARHDLESILHPLIWDRVRNFLVSNSQAGRDCVVEVPLLFENSRESEFDCVWVVAATPEIQRQRIRERNGWSDEEIERRLQSQMPLEEKCHRADLVLWNNGDITDLEHQLRSALQALRLGEGSV